MPLIRETLYDVRDRWNHHRIAHNGRNANVSGIPEVLYKTHPLSCGHDVDPADIAFGETLVQFQPVSGNEQFDDFAQAWILDNPGQWDPRTVASALVSHRALRQHAQQHF